MTSYVALLRKDKGSDYGVEFPDFPGCVTAGRSLDEARKMAAEALELHIEGMQEDGEAIPDPSSLDAIMTDPENASAVVFLVDAATRPAKSVRINIMLPADLIEAIDKVSRNRSGFLAEAARLKLREAV
jgi:predicted RNase H-like HicB family nuclease